MNLLITGFAPFGRETVNPSYEAVKLLPDHIGGIKITKAEMPVSFAASGPALKAAMARHRPDAVLCVGQAGGYSKLALERVAINLQDASLADNDGAQPVDQPVVPHGPAAYFSTLPVKKMAAALQEGGIPAFLSYSAGTYVCNHLLYTLLHFLHTEAPSIQGDLSTCPICRSRRPARRRPRPAWSCPRLSGGWSWPFRRWPRISRSSGTAPPSTPGSEAPASPVPCG